MSLTPARAPEDPPPTTGLTAKIVAATAFLVAAGALVDAGIALFTKVQPVTCRLPISPPWCSAPDDDLRAASTETDATRVNAFELQTPPQEIKPGFRKWTRVAPDVWEQLYPDGTKEYMYKIARINLYHCDGTIVSPKFDPNFQGFFPDKTCQIKEFMFRRLSDGKTWHSYVPIDHME